MVLVAWSTATVNGFAPTVVVATTRQPVPACPLHVAPLITDTVSPPPPEVPLSAAYTVPVAWSMSIQAGPRLSGIDLTGWPQPLTVVALQVAASMTEMLPVRFAT